MADVQISHFENFPAFDLVFNTLSANGAAHVHAVVLPGSISFNTVAVLVSESGSTQAGSSVLLTLRFGLYSRNGNTLSLANSASGAFTLSSNLARWLTLATSAAQNITPGSWYFWLQSVTSNRASVSLAVNNSGASIVDAGETYGGPFFRGYTSTNTNSNPPASIATSALTKEGASTNLATYLQPYILISA